MSADPDALTDADRSAIAALVADYAHAVDRREFDLLREVFVADAELDTGRATRRGIDEILDAMEGLRAYDSTFHLLGQQRLRGGPAAATGETYCDAHHLSTGEDGRRDRVMKIRYLDEFVPVDGAWRIAARRLQIDWTETRRLD